MKFDWANIHSPNDWVSEFESQIKTVPQAINLGEIFNDASSYQTYISQPTLKALEGHSLGFLSNKISDWAEMDVIVLSNLDSSSDQLNKSSIWNHLWQGTHQARELALLQDKHWLADEIDQYLNDIPAMCMESDPFSYTIKLSEGRNLGVVILPHLEETVLLHNTQTGDYLRFNADSALAYTRNMARDILTIALHEVGHLKYRCTYERHNVTNIITSTLEQGLINITHDDISSELLNTMYLRHEVEADDYALEMLNLLEKRNLISKDPIYRLVYLGHRALDTLAGGIEHMTSIALTSDTLRPRVNLLGFREALIDIHGEFDKRHLIETDYNDQSCMAQNVELYQNALDIRKSGTFKADPFATIMLDQFITAARACAPDYFEVTNAKPTKDLAAFRRALDYTL